MKTAAQIVVIDDHRVVGLGVKAAFEDQGADASITWSPTVREARWKRGQVAVLDLRLADGSAPDTNIAYINGYGIPVVVYTSGDDPYLVRRAIAGGALSIIRKSAPPDDLVEAVLAAAQVVHKIILMSELPSNAILARQFIQEFDGFSIGSNDMTQMVLATDRDNSSLSHIYDEEDPAVVWAILVTIFSGQKFGKKVGFCGQGVANSEVLRGLVAISGITSASVVPDTYYRTKQDFAAAEALNISASGLGKWLGEQHQAKLVKLLEAAGKADIAKLASDPAKIRAWYDAETARLHGELRDSLGGSRENTARKALKTFRATFHKPVIYAAWNWNETVEDALHQAGFATFEEQAAALAEQRKKLA